MKKLVSLTSIRETHAYGDGLIVYVASLQAMRAVIAELMSDFPLRAPRA
jgi:hypothetical protein